MSFYLWAVIGAIVFTLLGGPIGFVLYATLLAGFWCFTLKRGLLFIQAFVFLKTFHMTADIKESNITALSVGAFDTGRYIAEALHYAKMTCNGSQLKVIQQAEDIGFKHGQIKTETIFRRTSE